MTDSETFSAPACTDKSHSPSLYCLNKFLSTVFPEEEYTQQLITGSYDIIYYIGRNGEQILFPEIYTVSVDSIPPLRRVISGNNFQAKKIVQMLGS
jgi:hypothetical protein